MKLELGTVVNQRYRIKAHLSETARGSFHQAEDRDQDNALVLLKVCDTEADTFPSGNVSDWKEPEMFARLTHPQVAVLRDSGQWGHHGRALSFLAFNWISGEHLSGLLDRKADLEVGQAFTIALQLMDGLEYLHSDDIRILVLNLHPSCVWLDYSTDQPKPVVVDLGLAMPAGSSDVPERWHWSESFYLAPEVYNGLALPQSDVFSVAALLYRLIYGLPPWFVNDAPELFQQRKLIAAIGRQRARRLELDRYTHPLLDEHFEKVLRKGLTVDMETRVRTVQEFRESLRRDRKVKIHEPVREGRPMPARRTESGGGFSDVAGMEELKTLLRRDVIDALADRERYQEYGLTIPNGLLLYGPPGCGKTFIARKFAEELGCAVIDVRRSDIASIYVDGSVQKIRELFDAAKEASPAVLFLDEFESLAPDRGTDMHQTSRTEVNEFLTNLQGLSEHEVFVIAATNKPALIDAAVLRSGRIDKLVFVPPPDVEARLAMFHLHLSSRPTEVGLVEHQLATLTSNFVASDIKLIVDESARVALREKVRISQAILERVIASQRPSISADMIAGYEKQRQAFESHGRGGESESDTGRTQIGFQVTRDE